MNSKLKKEYEKSMMLPSDRLWEKIEERLDREPAAQASPLKKYISVAAVLMLLLGFTVVFYLNSENPLRREPQEFAERTSLSPSPEPSKEKVPGSLADATKSEETKEQIKSYAIAPQPVLEHRAPESPMRAVEETASTAIKPTPKPEVVAEAQKPAIKYITAEELLFERELTQTLSSQAKPQKLVKIQGFEKPKQVSLLGIPLYTEPNNTELNR